MKHTFARVAVGAALSTVALGQDPITTGAVQFLVAPPAAVYRDALQDNTRIVLFRERGAYMLTGNVIVDETGTGLVDQASDLDFGVLVAGTLVESYFFHQEGTDASSNLTLEGSATFARPILGVIVRQSQAEPWLESSDAKLGSPNTIYPGQPGDTNGSPQQERGLEFDQPDQFEVSSDRLTLSVRFRTSDRMDQVRVLTSAGIPATAFCFGDLSSGQDCPCQNNVLTGTPTGCANSTGLGGLLSYVSGSNSTSSAGDFTLRMSNLTPHTFGLVYMGQNATQELFADGFRCVNPGPPGSPPGVGFLRFPMQNATAQGEIVQSNIVGYMNGGPTLVIQPGATWHFQGYYRNPAMHCNNANLTNGLSVTFY